MISVAVAVWRGEKWIAAQLESLLEQTRPPDEIVICDDSPDDATERAIAPFRRAVRYFRNPARLGISGNFERAVTAATGEYIFLCDQDDVWDAGKIARLSGVLDAHPECEVVFCDSRVVDETLAELGYTSWDIQGSSPSELAGLEPEELWRRLLIHPVGYAHDMAFRRGFLDIALPFPEVSACHDFWIASLAAARGTLRIVPEALTSYRCHADNYTVVDRPGRTARLRELLGGGRAELLRTRRLYTALAARLADTELPEHSRELIIALARYYELRGAGRFGAVPWCDYRRFGAGWRTWCRDRLLPVLRPFS